MITIKEIAERIGVSPTTVSNVIHGKTREVSQGTIDRVMKIVEECNYVPNMNARNLARNDSKIIGIAMRAYKDKYENFIKDPFTSELFGAMEAEIRKRGYFTMAYVAEEMDEILKLVATWNVDGMVMLGAAPEEAQVLSRHFTKPVVYIDCYFDEKDTSYVNVGLEDYEGAYRATEYLVENGHEKIAFISDNLKGVDYHRFLGYRKALEEAGISYDESLRIQLKPEAENIDKYLAYLYDNWKKYTALFVVSDYYAVQIMNYLMDRGIEIPRDMSVIGFDDNILARNMRPKLTTVHQSPGDKGKAAIEQLFFMLGGQVLKKKHTVLPARLVIRETAGKINKRT